MFLLDLNALMKKSLRKTILCTLCLASFSILLLLHPLIYTSIFGEVGAQKNDWILFFGSFHPLLLHLPIGSLFLIFFLEVANLFKKTQSKNMLLPLVFHGVTAIAAAELGMLWYFSGSYSNASELLDDHMWQGLFYAATAIWLPLIYVKRKKEVSYVYLFSLCIPLLLLISAAHHGGESVHGSPMAIAPWETNKEPEVRTHTPKDDRVIYHEIIIPILDEKCYACHHSEKKVKSGLKLDTYADIILGGDNQDILPHLTPGDIKKSFLVCCIELPLDDDLHMPPNKKTQITEDELALLKWWVKVGAPEKAIVSDVEVPENIKLLINPLNPIEISE